MLTDDELSRLGRVLVADLPDAVIYADRDGTIRHWNAGAVRIFGYDETEAIGRSLDIIIPERLRGRHWEGFRRMMERGESRHGPADVLSVPAQAKSGATLSIQFTVAPVREETGRLSGIVAVLRDVTRDYLEMRRLRAAALRCERN